MTNRFGRTRLTKDFLRDLLKQLLVSKHGGTPEAVKIAEVTVTSAANAQWLRAQGDVAGGPKLLAPEKLSAIATALLAKVEELELGHVFRTCADAATARLAEILTNPDADTLHETLVTRVMDYLWKVVAPEGADETVLDTFENDVKKVFIRLRIDEIDAHLALSLLIFHASWLACTLGKDQAEMRAKIQIADRELWELLTPYHPADV